jgi:hypothetical protein
MARVINRRTLVAAISAAPVIATMAASYSGIIPSHTHRVWNRRLATYLRMRGAEEADHKDGAMRRAYDTHEAEKAAMVAEFGSSDAVLADPTGSLRWRAAFKRVIASEEQHCARFSRYRWRAADLILATPAPTVAAVITKMQIAQDEGFEGNGTFVIDTITADLRRLDRKGT